jgi:hypothetical protein
LRLGVAAAREGASDIMKPASLEGVAIAAVFIYSDRLYMGIERKGDDALC